MDSIATKLNAEFLRKLSSRDKLFTYKKLYKNSEAKVRKTIRTSLEHFEATKFFTCKRKT